MNIRLILMGVTALAVAAGPVLAADVNPWRTGAQASAQPVPAQPTPYGGNTYAPLDNSIPRSASPVVVQPQTRQAPSLPSPYGEGQQAGQGGYYGTAPTNQLYGYGGAPFMGGLGMPGLGLGLPGGGFPGVGFPSMGYPGMGYGGGGYPGMGYPGMGYPGMGYGGGGYPGMGNPGGPWGGYGQPGFGGPGYGGSPYGRGYGFNNGPRPWGPFW